MRAKGPRLSPFHPQETIDAVSHAGSLPMSIVFLNVAEEGEGEDDTRLQVGGLIVIAS